jgi:hypothetical protein
MQSISIIHGPSKIFEWCTAAQLTVHKRNKYMCGATLMLHRAGIKESLRIFEMPCRWTFNM